MTPWQKFITFLVIVLATSIAAQAFAEPIFFGFDDAKVCAAYNKTAPCKVRCGNFRYREAKKEYVWTDCPIWERIFLKFSQPTPTPSSTPQPSVGPTPCRGNPCDCGLPGWCATWIPEKDTVLCARCNLGQK